MKLYKDGKECNCDPHQLDQMIEAGWSKEKEPEKEPVKVTTRKTKSE